MHRFVDFLMVHTALKDDDMKGKEYIATYVGLNAN